MWRAYFTSPIAGRRRSDWIPVLELFVLNLPDYNPASDPASEEWAADYRSGQLALVVKQLDDDTAAEGVA